MNRKKKPRGFNLTEVMMAMCFITIAIFAVISVNVYALRSTEGSRSRQIANLVGTTQLSLVESYLKVDFHAPTNLVASTGRMRSTQFPEYEFVIDDLGYEDTGETLRRVQVRVFWNEDGWEHTYELATTLYYY